MKKLFLILALISQLMTINQKAEAEPITLTLTLTLLVSVGVGVFTGAIVAPGLEVVGTECTSWLKSKLMKKKNNTEEFRCKNNFDVIEKEVDKDNLINIILEPRTKHIIVINDPHKEKVS